MTKFSRKPVRVFFFVSVVIVVAVVALGQIRIRMQRTMLKIGKHGNSMDKNMALHAQLHSEKSVVEQFQMQYSFIKYSASKA